MKSFAQNKLADFQFSNGLAQALAEAEKGHGSEIILQKTDTILLEQLRKSAIISSTIASCAIEGIHAPNFEETVTKPTTRNLTRAEQELNSYKNALDFIYRLNPDEIRITPDFIRQIHNYVMDHSGHGGELKTQDNLIREEREDGSFLVRFIPVKAQDAERYLEQLCLFYNEASQKKLAPELLAIAAFTLDFTAIHPFADGNGRTSRVLTTAALLAAGYQLPKYISLEEIIDNRSEDYYRALQLSSEHWHTGEHNLQPFLTFQTKVIAQGYKELELRRERSKAPLTAILSNGIPEKVREVAWQEFTTFYPAATLELTHDPIKETSMKGLKSEMPDKAEWERLTHAHRLLRNLVAKAREARANKVAPTRLDFTAPAKDVDSGVPGRCGGPEVNGMSVPSTISPEGK